MKEQNAITGGPNKPQGNLVKSQANLKQNALSFNGASTQPINGTFNIKRSSINSTGITQAP